MPGVRVAVAASQVDRPAPTHVMRSITPSIVGLTLAVNLGVGRGVANASHPGLPQIRCLP
jgi:hypothetical protein